MYPGTCFHTFDGNFTVNSDQWNDSSSYTRPPKYYSSRQLNLSVLPYIRIVDIVVDIGVIFIVFVLAYELL
jgi:hypothetical protein